MTGRPCLGAFARPRRDGGTRWRSLPVAAVLSTALMAGAPPLEAQLEIFGQVDLTAKAGTDQRGLNQNFHGDSPFNGVRGRLFARRWLTDQIGVFTEVLFDDVSGPRVQGAYLVLNELGGREWLNARAGLAPSLIGSFGIRSTYFNANPLLGVPLVWQHRTTLDGSGLASSADLIRRRDQNVIAMPMLYDACWGLQWELLGTVGIFEYSVGAIASAMSNPGFAQTEDGVQILTRIGVEPSLGIRLGVSGGLGPYIGGANRDPGTLATSYPGKPKDYDQRLVGFDAELVRGRAQLRAEGYHSIWQAPLVPEDLSVMGGYVEAAYDVTPRLLGAVRVGALTFSEISLDGSGTGPTTGWDDDVVRVEFGATYRLAREVHLRLGWQRTEFLTGSEDPENLLALQLRAVF